MAESEIFGRYRELWQERYGVPCALILSPLDYGKLGTHLHEFGVTYAQMMAALEGFFATDNPLVLKRKHPLGLFLVNPMQYVPAPTERRYQASCPHRPICPNMSSCCNKQDMDLIRAGKEPIRP